MTPYEDITFAIVVWNDAERLRPLLEYVRPWFQTLAVAVQESSDDTLDVALGLADIVVKDKHHGFGDASFGPRLLPQVKTTWTFKVDADEWPDEELLGHLGQYVREADAKPTKGVWIPFRSWIDDRQYTEQHAHLRLFQTAVGWPGLLHSRPPIDNGIMGTVGHIEHRRSLDEMMRDYLSYYEVGSRNPQWVAHNRLMMRSACEGAAKQRGWKHVKAFPWWPDVRDAAFEGKEPTMVVFCAGAPRTGTRMIYDIVNQLGQEAVHAVIPGYNNKPGGGLDLDNPVWWTTTQMEERFGAGEWIVIDRDHDIAAKSAVAAGKIADESEYERIWKRAHKAIGDVGGLVLDYEQVVADPQRAVDLIAEFLGVPSVQASGIFDGDEKYRAEEDADEGVEEAQAPDAISADMTIVSDDVEKEA